MQSIPKTGDLVLNTKSPAAYGRRSGLCKVETLRQQGDSLRLAIVLRPFPHADVAPPPAQ